MKTWRHLTPTNIPLVKINHESHLNARGWWMGMQSLSVQLLVRKNPVTMSMMRRHTFWQMAGYICHRAIYQRQQRGRILWKGNYWMTDEKFGKVKNLRRSQPGSRGVGWRTVRLNLCKSQARGLIPQLRGEHQTSGRVECHQLMPASKGWILMIRDFLF